jgi:hypothetical protein
VEETFSADKKEQGRHGAAYPGEPLGDAVGVKGLIQVVEDHHHNADNLYLVGGKPPSCFVFVHVSSVGFNAVLDKAGRLSYTKEVIILL